MTGGRTSGSPAGHSWEGGLLNRIVAPRLTVCRGTQRCQPVPGGCGGAAGRPEGAGVGRSPGVCACASALRWQPPRHGGRPIVPALCYCRQCPPPAPRHRSAARPCRRCSGSGGGCAAPLLPSASGCTPPGAGAASGRSVRAAVLSLAEEAGEKLAKGFRCPVHRWSPRFPFRPSSPGLAAGEPGGGGGQAGLQSLCAGGGGGGDGGHGDSDAAGVWEPHPEHGLHTSVGIHLMLGTLHPDRVSPYPTPYSALSRNSYPVVCRTPVFPSNRPFQAWLNAHASCIRLDWTVTNRLYSRQMTAAAGCTQGCLWQHAGVPKTCCGGIRPLWAVLLLSQGCHLREMSRPASRCFLPMRQLPGRLV